MPLGKQLTHTAYGFGQLAEGIKNSSFELFVFFYYNQVLGLSGTLAGLATFLALFFDAVSDPLAVLFALLFRPPAGLGQEGSSSGC
jgi:Na+/melibiose symporter-like transporter